MISHLQSDQAGVLDYAGGALYALTFGNGPLSLLSVAYCPSLPACTLMLRRREWQTGDPASGRAPPLPNALHLQPRYEPLCASAISLSLTDFEGVLLSGVAGLRVLLPLDSIFFY